MKLGRSGFLPDRTIHLHPIGRCNLACLHCYSTSSPQAGGVLPVELLERALAVLRGEGYEVLSLSGGEPLLYPDLPRLARAARALGFRVVAISNGYRVRAAFDDVVRLLDGLAISFDGMATVHNRVRGQAHAFDAAVAGLAHLRALGVPAAAAYTVSRELLPDTPEFVEMAHDLGVRAVQLRPLVMAGRATESYADAALGPDDLIRLYLMGEALAQAYAGTMTVHTDLAHAQAIAASRPAYAAVLAAEPGHSRLSDFVNPLVVTPDATLKPLTFDFPPAYDLGHLADADEAGVAPMRELAFRNLGHLIAAALDRAADSSEFIDWFAFCRDVARAQSPDATPAKGLVPAT